MTGPAARPVPAPTAPAPDPPRVTRSTAAEPATAVPAAAQPAPPETPPAEAPSPATEEAPGFWPEAPAGALDAAPPSDDEPPWPDEPAAAAVAGTVTVKDTGYARRGAPAARVAGNGREPTPAGARPAVEALRAVIPGRVVRYVPAAAASGRTADRDDEPDDPATQRGELDADATDDTSEGGTT